MMMLCKLVCESQRLSASTMCEWRWFSFTAQDYEELMLTQSADQKSVTTFVAKANRDNDGDHDGDMLVVDRGLTDYRDVVIAGINGEFTVKRYKIEKGVPS